MQTAVKHPWPAAVPGLKRPLTSWADFHPSGETAGNIQQLIPMREQRTEDRQDGFHLLNIRMVNSHRSRAMAMMTGAMFPGY